ncbi:glycosyltransferase [Pluralibacter gergoviae]|uniref:Glycosyltransferase n=1 Tax=Pluralibacter gergoviae TaxID=61647 RepID=A0AAW8HLM6_PLUGE|nr:glycosyltransferase [Pluralibacter gergoviae]AVR05008.1 glycosyl transferase family 1 [Pluralibacter gergoviae]KMK08933.1 hypothetical protein ABW07_08975 [Pluralibacter gergoviae]MDQ2309092.1 glycosyltransferase [Pluralibacter gergoviae]
MKILQFGKYYPPVFGGIESVMFDLTEGLNDIGHQCDVLCSNNVNEYVDEYYNNKYKVIRTPSLGKFASTSLSPKMIGALKKTHADYDIIHVHLPDPMANIALNLISVKAKVVIHWHSDIVKQKFLKYLYAPVMIKLLERADAIIATSEEYAKSSYWLQRYKSKVTIVPIGIKDPCQDMNLLTKPQSYNSKKIVFSLGRMAYYKGFEYLIKAAHYLTDEYKIVIAGGGELIEEYRKLIKDEGLDKRVELVGRISDKEINSYYHFSDLFCLPSVARSEAFGVVLLEAMAHSKPVVATNILGSGTSWVNKHTVSGLNVPICDSQAIANAITTIVNSEDLSNRYSLGARQRFEENFTREEMVTKTEALYQKLVGE